MINLKLFWGKGKRRLFLLSIFFGMFTGILNLSMIYIVTNIDMIIDSGGAFYLFWLYIFCSVVCNK